MNQPKLSLSGSESWKRMLAILLVAIMVLVVAAPAASAETGEEFLEPVLPEILPEDTGGIDNVVSGAPIDPTPDASSIWYNPVALNPSVVTGNTVTENLVIGNAGTTELTYNSLTNMFVSMGSTDALPPIQMIVYLAP